MVLNTNSGKKIIIELVSYLNSFQKGQKCLDIIAVFLEYLLKRKLQREQSS